MNDIDSLKSTYKAIASVVLADPAATISGRTILDGKPFGERVSDMATQLHNVGVEHGALLALAKGANEDGRVLKLLISGGYVTEKKVSEARAFLDEQR